MRVLTRLAAFLHARGIASMDGLSRAVLEAYLADLHAAFGGRSEHSTHVGAIGLFLTAIRQQANLARQNKPSYRLVTIILIRCGLRVSDALKLPFDCVVTDDSGAPYLRYRNHKMKREALVPLDDELVALIRGQQQRCSPASRSSGPSARADPVQGHPGPARARPCRRSRDLRRSRVGSENLTVMALCPARHRRPDPPPAREDNAWLRRQLARALGDERTARTRSGNNPAP